MLFDSKHAAKQWFLNYKPLTEEVPSFWYENEDFKNWKFGDFVLFQHIMQEGGGRILKIGRPVLGLFCDFTVWDQALVLQYVQQPRAWMNSHTIKPNPKYDYIFTLYQCWEAEVEFVQFWTDNIKVLGHWKAKPAIRELRAALKNCTSH